jgi:hypothetical protein
MIEICLENGFCRIVEHRDGVPARAPEPLLTLGPVTDLAVDLYIHSNNDSAVLGPIRIYHLEQERPVKFLFRPDLIAAACGSHLYLVDFATGEKLIETELEPWIYGLLSFHCSVVVVGELGVRAFERGRELWKTDLFEIVTRFSRDEDSLKVETDDGATRHINLRTGRAVRT